MLTALAVVVVSDYFFESDFDDESPQAVRQAAARVIARIALRYCFFINSAPFVYNLRIIIVYMYNYLFNDICPKC